MFIYNIADLQKLRDFAGMLLACRETEPEIRSPRPRRWLTLRLRESEVAGTAATN
jgi:hypothetical protein